MTVGPHQVKMFTVDKETFIAVITRIVRIPIFFRTEVDCLTVHLHLKLQLIKMRMIGVPKEWITDSQSLLQTTVISTFQ